MADQTRDWNITVIDEGRLFEHKQTGKIVFVPKQTDAALIIKCMRVAIKSLIKELAK
jgi:hypothetical protein